jgi:hypothetical protein
LPRRNPPLRGAKKSGEEAKKSSKKCCFIDMKERKNLLFLKNKKMKKEDTPFA